MKKDDCIFCKLAGGDIPTNMIYEDELFSAFLDMGPATKGHALLLPKNHYADLFELGEEEAKALIPTAQKIAKRMKMVLDPAGLNLVQNNGEAAGQTVFHFHLHLIPRYEDDGQKIGWKPGAPTPEELAKLKESLKG